MMPQISKSGDRVNNVMLQVAGAEYGRRAADREVLYQQLSPLVRRLLIRYGRTPELRQDLPGEIYYQFCQLLESFDPQREVPLPAYLAHMLPIRVFNYVQTYWRFQNRYISAEPETLEAALPLSSENSDLWDETLHADQVLNALPDAIAALPHRQRLVLVWRYYDERSFEDIAAMLGIQPATARSLLRHAIKSLRGQMMKQGIVEKLCAAG